MPVDYFSATFERTYNFPQATTSFVWRAIADDSVRIYLDNDPIINEWHPAEGLTYTAVRPLSGVHTIRIEYLELVGVASIRFVLDVSNGPPPWQATYYEGAPNRGPQKATGSDLAGARQLDKTWGDNSPFPVSCLPTAGTGAGWASSPLAAATTTSAPAPTTACASILTTPWSSMLGQMAPMTCPTPSATSAPARTRSQSIIYDRSGYAYLQVFWYADQFGPSYAP